jgi:hypothetical protein
MHYFEQKTGGVNFPKKAAASDRIDGISSKKNGKRGGR